MAKKRKNTRNRKVLAQHPIECRVALSRDMHAAGPDRLKKSAALKQYHACRLSHIEADTRAQRGEDEE